LACDLTKGRKHPCKDVVGGLKNLYFANFNAAIYAEKTVSSGLIDQLLDTPASPIDLYKYELRSSGHNLEDANEVSGEAGTSFYNPSITAILKKIDASTREELQLATFGRPHVIVEDYNGNFFFVGMENGCDVQVNMVTGSAMGETSGFNLTITGQEKEMSFLVDPTIIGDGTQTEIVEGTV